MHASLEQLLQLREAGANAPAPEPEVATHVRGCPECAGELARLREVRARLQSLPPLPPPAHSWAAIQARVRSGQTASPGAPMVVAGEQMMSTAATVQVQRLPATAPPLAGTREVAWLHRASAAGLAAIVALLAVIALRIESPATPTQMAAVDYASEMPFSATPPPQQVSQAVPSVSSHQLILQERSRRLEQMLHATHRPAVVNVRAASTIEALESELAQLDYHLTMGAEPLSADEQLSMWQQRVQLLNTLLDVRANNGVRQTAF